MTRSSVILIFVSMFVLTACFNQERAKKNKDIIGQVPMWDFDCDSILKLRNVNADTLDYLKLIEGINDKYLDKVVLEFVKISRDTIFVAIKNSVYLTQQMGSCGAEQYIITVTFTLTELQNIKNVSFDFVAGDHASPGIVNRETYWDLVKHCDRLNNEIMPLNSKKSVSRVLAIHCKVLVNQNAMLSESL